MFKKIKKFFRDRTPKEQVSFPLDTIGFSNNSIIYCTPYHDTCIDLDIITYLMCEKTERNINEYIDYCNLLTYYGIRFITKTDDNYIYLLANISKTVLNNILQTNEHINKKNRFMKSLINEIESQLPNYAKYAVDIPWEYYIRKDPQNYTISPVDILNMTLNWKEKKQYKENECMNLFSHANLLSIMTIDVIYLKDLTTKYLDHLSIEKKLVTVDNNDYIIYKFYIIDYFRYIINYKLLERENDMVKILETEKYFNISLPGVEEINVFTFYKYIYVPFVKDILNSPWILNPYDDIDEPI